MKPRVPSLFFPLKPAASAFALCVVTAALTSPISAQAIWQGDVSTDWNTAGNWDTNAVPATSVDAVFDNTATSTSVRLSATGTARNITFSADAPAFTLSGGQQLNPLNNGFTLTNNSNNTQDLTALSQLRPFSNSGTPSVNYIQNTSATLKLPLIQGTHTTANINTRQVFSGIIGGTIEVAAINDRQLGSNTTSVLLNGPVTVKILGDGNFTGAKYSTGAAVTLRNGGVVSVGAVANSGINSPLGSGGSIDFGDGSPDGITGTLRFTGSGIGSTNRQFRIHGTSIGVFDVTEATGNLQLSAGIAQRSGTSGGNLTKSGAGTLTLAGAGTFSGPTTVSAGKLVLTNSQALQNSAYNTTASIVGGLDVTGLTTLSLGGLIGDAPLASCISGYDNLDTLVLNPQSGVTATYSQTITDTTQGLRLTKSGAGTQVLQAVNTFSANTTIIGGTLTLGHPTNTLPDNTTVTINGGTLDLGENNDTVDLVTLTSGSITSTTGVLTAADFAVSAGTISASLGGSAALTKSGSSTVTLTGNNSYMGGTTINSGALSVSSDANLGDASGTVSIGGGSLFMGSGFSSARAISIDNPSSSIALNVATSNFASLSGPISVASGGQLRFGDGGGTLNLSGTVTGSGSILFVVQGMNVVLDAGFSWSNAADMLIGRTATASAVTAQGTSNTAVGSILLNHVNTSTAATLTIQDNASLVGANLDLNHNGTATSVGTVNLNGGSLTVNAVVKTRTGANQTAVLNLNGGELKAGASSASFWPNLAGTTANVLVGGAKIHTNSFDITIAQSLLAGATPDGGLEKKGAGTLSLTAANTYTGPTTVTEGTLSLGDGTNPTNLADESSVSIATGAQMALNFSGDDTVASVTLGGTTYTTPGAIFNASTFGAFFTGSGSLVIGGSSDDYTTWANSFTPAIGLPSADDDGDGLNNFEEYAFGLLPNSSASVNPISQPLNKATGQFKYTRRASADVGYSYESSTTLSGNWPGFTPVAEDSNNASPVEEISVTVPASLLAEPQLFLRVKAVKP